MNVVSACAYRWAHFAPGTGNKYILLLSTGASLWHPMADVPNWAYIWYCYLLSCRVMRAEIDQSDNPRRGSAKQQQQGAFKVEVVRVNDSDVSHADYSMRWGVNEVRWFYCKTYPGTCCLSSDTLAGHTYKCKSPPYSDSHSVHKYPGLYGIRQYLKQYKLGLSHSQLSNAQNFTHVLYCGTIKPWHGLYY